MNDLLARKRARAKVLYHLAKKCDVNSEGDALKLYYFFKNIKIKGFPISFSDAQVVLKELKCQMPTVNDSRINYLGGLLANSYGRTRMFSGRVEKRKVYKEFGAQK